MTSKSLNEKQANLTEEEINTRHAEKMRREESPHATKIMATKTIEKRIN